LSELKRSELSVRQERAVLVGVVLPGSTADPRDPLGELGSLAKTAGAKVVGQILQKRHSPDSGTYIGSGKAEEVAQLAMNAVEKFQRFARKLRRPKVISCWLPAP